MQMRFASGLPHASICEHVPVGPSRFIHVEQSLHARRAPNRGVVVAGIRATFP
jgi:hypothetical protein